MQYDIKERCVILGDYIAQTGQTVRACAVKFGVSKSTVHKDVAYRLKKLDPVLYMQVKEVLEINKSERHIRGGMSTKKKYKQTKIYL